MKTLRARSSRPAAVASGVLAIGLAACGGEAATTAEEAAPSGPATIEVVRVLEQPLDVTLAIPG